MYMRQIDTMNYIKRSKNLIDGIESRTKFIEEKVIETQENGTKIWATHTKEFFRIEDVISYMYR